MDSIESVKSVGNVKSVERAVNTGSMERSVVCVAVPSGKSMVYLSSSSCGNVHPRENKEKT